MNTTHDPSSRRSWLRRLLQIGGGLAVAPLARASPAPATPKALRIQTLALAGFQFHFGPSLWPQPAEGQPLRLQREADNRYDPLAVAVHWQQQRLGYLPRRHNGAIAQMLDDGRELSARISRLEDGADPWRRVELEVWWWPGGGGL